MLEPFGDSLYVAEGPTVSFFGFPYPTRMAIARLADGSAWVWSPVALTPELASAAEAVGRVRHIVSPNKLHHLFLGQWAQRWPDARVYAPPGLARKKPELRFDAALGDVPDPAWAADIDQVVFHGSFALEEVVFFHRPSKAAIFCDLIQRHAEADATGWKGAIMRMDGLVGDRGSTPKEWRATFLRRAPARAARDQVLAWNPERLLIPHGECVEAGARAVVAAALAWI